MSSEHIHGIFKSSLSCYVIDRAFLVFSVTHVYLLIDFLLNLDLPTYQRNYLVINHIGAIRAEHDEFAIRFASAMNQVFNWFIE